ncbi:Hsp20/alpha crystallin family protein [Devosia sp.]|uniref:Hsp20/alpha crystallin family protein n=1 Tax=Devosia sp. TaxID=1871048 RepID=UPI002EEF9E28
MKARNTLPTTQGNRTAMSPFDVLQDRIDRMFEDFSSGFRMPSLLSNWPSMPMTEMGNGGFDLVPSLDLHETDGEIIISAELPGMEERDIDISVADDVLTISGEKKSAHEQKEGERYRSERSYGRFSRSIGLPFDIDAGKVMARYDKGVLTLTVPKPVEAKQKTKKIAIRH